MSRKRSEMDFEKRKFLRQVVGRYSTKFSMGGREKRATRPVPSLPKINCLEKAEPKEEERGSDSEKLSDQGS